MPPKITKSITTRTTHTTKRGGSTITTRTTNTTTVRR